MNERDSEGYVGLESGLPTTDQLDLSEEGRAVPVPWRRRLVIGGAAFAVLLLASAGATAGYLAWTNKTRADDWQSRASELEVNVVTLNQELDERTDDLNARTEDLNEMAAKVAAASRAIERSEADVKRLEVRQRQLANEKAQVEDERALVSAQADAIEEVASAFITCKRGLTQALDYIFAGNYSALDVIAPRVNADCGTAERALASYQTTYG